MEARIKKWGSENWYRMGPLKLGSFYLKAPVCLTLINTSVQGDTRHNENALPTESSGIFLSHSTHPKREVAKGDTVVSKAIARLQNFLIKVREQVSWQQEEITESGETK